MKKDLMETETPTQTLTQQRTPVNGARSSFGSILATAHPAVAHSLSPLLHRLLRRCDTLSQLHILWWCVPGQEGCAERQCGLVPYPVWE
jgi:hypothetical protein|mmetsp:Transcript_43163/g.63479  ORF Transcript_43163/g.63479 Transcript_43163/m.63479 type:complete len:89 (+) Transcript_43163:134-400(+)